MFKRLFCWAYFAGNLFSEGLVIGKNFAFQNGLGLAIKTARNTNFKHNSLKPLKTVNTNSPWAYIWEGLLSKGYLHLRFGGLLFIYFFFFGGGGEGLLSEFYSIHMYENGQFEIAWMITP